MCLKGVEAYIVKDMKAQMLIGEDTQSKWNLHTVHQDGERYWQVGKSPHRIAAVEGNIPSQEFSASLAQEPDGKPRTQAKPASPIE
jgi:hypothetical protein